MLTTALVPLKIATEKGKIHSQKAVIAFIPVSFSDINGIVRTAKKKVVALEEVSSIYLGANFIYDTGLFRYNDIEGLYFKVGDTELVKIPFIWKKASKSVNLLATEFFVLRPSETRVVEVKALNMGSLNETSNLLIHDDHFHANSLEETDPAYSVIPRGWSPKFATGLKDMVFFGQLRYRHVQYLKINIRT